MQRFLSGEFFNTFSYGFQSLIKPISQKKDKKQDQNCIYGKRQPEICRNPIHVAAGKQFAEPHICFFIQPYYQEKITRLPHGHRIIVKIPSCKDRHILQTVRKGKILRKLPVPDHPSLIVQSHHPLTFHIFHFFNTRSGNFPAPILLVKLLPDLFYGPSAEFRICIRFYCSVSPVHKRRHIKNQHGENNDPCGNRIAENDFQKTPHTYSFARRYPSPRAVRSQRGWEGSCSIFSRRCLICTIKVFSYP